MTAGALFELIAVRCFFCPHAERALDPRAAHDQMEAHYAARHRADVGRVLRALDARRPRVVRSGRPR